MMIIYVKINVFFYSKLVRECVCVFVKAWLKFIITHELTTLGIIPVLRHIFVHGHVLGLVPGHVSGPVPVHVYVSCYKKQIHIFITVYQ